MPPVDADRHGGYATGAETAMSREQQLLQLLGVDHPIVQAPMAGVATPELAAAVCNAGALGSLGVGNKTADAARDMIVATRALTNKPFNVNFFCHEPAVTDRKREAAWLDYLQPLFAEFDAAVPDKLDLPYTSFSEDRSRLDMLLQQRPAVVSFIFGVPPAEWLGELRDAGIVTLGCVTTPAEAMRVAEAGVDVIVAQGVEAGGHRGVFEPTQGDQQLGLFALVCTIAAQSERPVIAAGGIMTGAGIAEALQMGAAGVQMGTAFIACLESSAKDAHRAALVDAAHRETRITDAISGRPARGLVNRLHTDIADGERPPLPDYPIGYGAAKALAAAAAAHDNHDFDAQWAGQGAALAREMPAAEMVEILVQEWRDASV